MTSPLLFQEEVINENASFQIIAQTMAAYFRSKPLS